VKKLGLIGYPLGHSFSKKYYLEKFEKEQISGIDYDLYAIENIADFPGLYREDPDFYGVNVTIPHKISVLPYLDELSEEAKAIAAVNCIQIRHSSAGIRLKGFNTDVYGFRESLKPLLQQHHSKALILGKGGAAKAVEYALKELNIAYTFVSRTKSAGQYTYAEISPDILATHPLIINCRPVILTFHNHF